MSSRRELLIGAAYGAAGAGPGPERSEVPSDGEQTFATFEVLTRSRPKAPLVRTLGYRNPGDGGGGVYVRKPVVPRKVPWQFTDASGEVWCLEVTTVDPRMFGAVGDGLHDDTDAIQSALDYTFERGGGGMVILPALKFRTRGLQIRKGVSIVGGGRAVRSHYPETLQSFGYALLLDPLQTIEMQEGSGINGILILPAGMNFPQSQQQISDWSGTAISIGPEAHGVSIVNSTVIGFMYAIRSGDNGPAMRILIENVTIDCHNGVHIRNAPDIPQVSQVHCWPFASTGRRERNYIRRSGIAFRFSDRVDWGRMTDCFALGYEVGYELDGVFDCTLTGCGADHNAKIRSRSSVGFRIRGQTNGARLIGCQVAAQGVGIVVEAVERPTHGPPITTVLGCTLWDNEIGISQVSGYLNLSETTFRQRGGIKLGDGIGGTQMRGVTWSRMVGGHLAGSPQSLKRVRIRDEEVVSSRASSNKASE